MAQSSQIWPNVINLTKRYKSDLTLQNWPNVTTVLMRKIWYLLISCSHTFPFALHTRLVRSRSDMDRFLIIKWPASISPTRSSLALSKKPSSCTKQGNVSAADRVEELFLRWRRQTIFAGLAILVDHFRKDSVRKYVNSNVSMSVQFAGSVYICYMNQ